MKLYHKIIHQNETGHVIVEASFIFPIMFFVLFFLIYFGNTYYIRAQIDALVAQKAFEGADYCVDPLLEQYKETGSLPDLSQLDAKPYRYIFGGMNEIESKISREVQETIETKNAASFFSGMQPVLKTRTGDIASFNNYVVYSTFSVGVEYSVQFPIRFIGESTPTVIDISSRAEVPVGDTTEFIRNTDMVIDMFSGTAMGQKIAEIFQKVNDFISQFAKK